jgi:hypothetical protein
MISMYMYLAMLYPINALIWLYATTAYHVYWNVSDNCVICHICIPYYILKNFRLSCFSTIGIYPFIYSNLFASPSFAVNVNPFGSSHKLTKDMSRKVFFFFFFFFFFFLFFFLYCGRTLQESDVLTLA